MRISKLHKRGFTLIELLVVVMIALILAVIAVGSYSTMKQRRSLRSAAESVNSAFVTARSYALSRNAWHRVVIQLRDPETNAENFAFWIDEVNPNSDSLNANPDVPEVAVRSRVVPEQGLPEGVRFLDVSVRGTTITAAGATGDLVVVRFRPNGTSDEANVRLQEDSTATNTGPILSEVRLFPATAKSRIVAMRP